MKNMSVGITVWNLCVGLMEKTYCYALDIKTYDRSQEHPALRTLIEFYKTHGLNAERLRKWESTHGVKRASAMMFGVLIHVVLAGVSGIFDTLFRNGLVNLAALLVSTNVLRSQVITLDIKGDDGDLEFSVPINVEMAVDRLSLSFNFSAKFFTNDVRYMCKQFRIRFNGRWFFVADPWARAQSACTPALIGDHEDGLKERWISLNADLRHYGNGILVDAVAEMANQYYQLPVIPYGIARSWSKFVADEKSFYNFFHPPQEVS